MERKLTGKRSLERDCARQVERENQNYLEKRETLIDRRDCDWLRGLRNPSSQIRNYAYPLHRKGEASIFREGKKCVGSVGHLMTDDLASWLTREIISTQIRRIGLGCI